MGDVLLSARGGGGHVGRTTRVSGEAINCEHEGLSVRGKARTVLALLRATGGTTVPTGCILFSD